MPAPLLSKTHIITQFNALVRDLITGPYPAVWSITTLPTNSGPLSFFLNSGQLGSATEQTFVEADLEPPTLSGDFAVSRIFYVLHGFAMALTRVRMANNVYYTGTTEFRDSARAALAPELALYFPIPTANIPDAGTSVTAAQLDLFLGDLKTLVEDRRTNMAYAHVFYSTCHTNCHGSCHGSRGRR